jgi:hypothetical protein
MMMVNYNTIKECSLKTTVLFETISTKHQVMDLSSTAARSGVDFWIKITPAGISMFPLDCIEADVSEKKVRQVHARAAGKT